MRNRLPISNPVPIRNRDSGLKKNIPLAWLMIIPTIGSTSMPPNCCASWNVLTLAEIKTFKIILNSTNIGITQNIRIIQVEFKNKITLKYGYAIIFTIMALMIKAIKEIPSVGMRDAKTFPRNRSLIEIGANNKVSNVFLSFSPTKLFDEVTIELMMATIKKNGIIIKVRKKYTNLYPIVGNPIRVLRISSFGKSLIKAIIGLSMSLAEVPTKSK